MTLLTVALIIGAIAAPNTRGKTLQQIEVERYGEPLSPELATASNVVADHPVPSENVDRPAPASVPTGGGL